MTKDQLAQYKKGYRAYNANREIEKQREAESYSRMYQEQNTPQPETPQQPSQEGGFFNSLKNLFSGESKPNTFQPKLLPPKPISKPIEFKDVFNKDSLSLPMRSQAEQNKINEQANQWQNNPLKPVADKTVAGVTSFGDSATMGGLSLNMKKTNPEMYDTAKKLQAENPYTSMAGNFAGYVVPGMAIGKGLKALSLIPKIANPILKTGATAGIEGALMGGIEGVTEGIREDYSVGQTAKNSLLKGAEFGATGALLGGGLAGLGQLGKKALPAIKSRVIGENAFDVPFVQQGKTWTPPQTLDDVKFINSMDRKIYPTENVNKFDLRNRMEFEGNLSNRKTFPTENPFKKGRSIQEPLINSKLMPSESNLRPLKNEGSMISPSSKLNTLKTLKTRNNVKLVENPQLFRQSENISQNPAKFADDFQNKLSELENSYKNTINNIKNNKVMDPDLKSKVLKAEGMKYSASKRELIQGDSLIPVEGGLTEKELANKINKMKSNYSGKEVITPDGEGIATGQSSFGKVGVRVNGEIKYYPKEQIQNKINVDDLIAQQKQSNIKPLQQEPIQRVEQPTQNVSIPSNRNQSSQVGNMVDNSADIGTGNFKNRQFIENSTLNSDAVPSSAKKELKNNIPKYEQISNQKTLEEAQRIVDSNFDEAINNFRTSKKLDNAVDTAIGETLIQRAYAKGDFNTGNEIALNLAEKLTNAGQIVQAASIMKRMTPEGMLKHITKTLANNKGKSLTTAQSEAIYNNMKLVQAAEQGNLKLLDIDLQLFGRENASLREQLSAMAREQGDTILDAVMARRVSDAALDNVSFIAANNLPVSKMDKVNAWRRMAMLANPKTHIRNFVGNAIMGGLRKTSDTIGAGLEKLFVKQGERTKSIGWSKDTDIVRAVENDWLLNKNAMMKGGKFDFDTVFLNNEKQIFDKGRLTKFIEKQTGKQYDKGILEAMNEFSRDALNASDNIFLQRAYKDALGGYMKANGLKAVTNESRLYAARRGYEAVFKQANEFSNWISRMKSKGGVGGAILEAKVPFTKTPSNILLRGIEYSPVGLLKGLYGAAKGKTAAAVIEDLSKGLTGTGIFGLGLTLGAMGWARTETSKSKALRSLESESGKQPYSIDTPFGNYTFEWAQPTSIPFAIGVATMEAMAKKAKGEEDLKAHEMIMKGLAAGGDTLFNTTMLKGLSDLVGGKYGSPTEAILNVPADYIQQSIPSVLGMITKTIDDTKRDTSGGFVDLAKSKIPFLSKTLPAKVDVYGNEEKQPGFVQQFFSPGTYKSDKSDATTKELLRLNKATGETRFLPSMIQKNVSYQTGKKTDSKKFILPPNIKESYAKQLGQASKFKLDQIVKSGEYKNASDKDKVKLLDSAMNKVKEEQETKLLKSQGIKEYKSSSSRASR